MDDLYIGFQLLSWLPQEFQSTMQQIYRWKEEDFRVVKIEAELILEANRLQLMKQDLEKAENAYLSSFTSKKSNTLPGATAATHGDPNGKKDNQKKVVSNVTAKTKNGSIEIWHQRFCRVNNDYLVKTSKNDSVRGLPRLTDNGKTHCIPCKLANSKRVSFKKTGAVRSKRPLELLHMDLCGPMPTERQGGNKYFLSIIDDYSRKVTVFPIRNKSDVFHTFIRFQKRAERFLSKKVIAVRTDGGLEFCNKDMDNFLTELGIKHEVTNSYTPEMNGVEERFNLTALDGIKTLLKSSEVPHKFSGEALLCFIYAWNRICHKDSNKTPFEKYSGRKPSVLHLIPFGCLAYAATTPNPLPTVSNSHSNNAQSSSNIFKPIKFMSFESHSNSTHILLKNRKQGGGEETNTHRKKIVGHHGASRQAINPQIHHTTWTCRRTQSHPVTFRKKKRGWPNNFTNVADRITIKAPPLMRDFFGGGPTRKKNRLSHRNWTSRRFHVQP
ncbi:retrovirus-related Pol polyprotein from transposon TNT 1-94 [Trichonephila clavipes]|nr:retrovirus-related Pol polyprotein from transposon TNT 1-94 [Trichonephila clavipes]